MFFMRIKQICEKNILKQFVYYLKNKKRYKYLKIWYDFFTTQNIILYKFKRSKITHNIVRFYHI